MDEFDYAGSSMIAEVAGTQMGLFEAQMEDER